MRESCPVCDRDDCQRLLRQRQVENGDALRVGAWAEAECAENAVDWRRRAGQLEKLWEEACETTQKEIEYRVWYNEVLNERLDQMGYVCDGLLKRAELAEAELAALKVCIKEKS